MTKEEFLEKTANSELFSLFEIRIELATEKSRDFDASNAARSSIYRDYERRSFAAFGGNCRFNRAVLKSDLSKVAPVGIEINAESFASGQPGKSDGRSEFVISWEDDKRLADRN